MCDNYQFYDGRCILEDGTNSLNNTFSECEIEFIVYIYDVIEIDNYLNMISENTE